MSPLKRPESNPFQPPVQPKPPKPKTAPSGKKGPWVFDVDAVTLVLVITAVLLFPILLTGFFSH
jgi:hypothetical protein